MPLVNKNSGRARRSEPRRSSPERAKAYRLVHALPGRYRFAVPCIKGNRERSGWLAGQLGRANGAGATVSVSPVTGNLLIITDAAVTEAEAARWLEACLENTPLPDNAPAPAEVNAQSRAPVGVTAGAAPGHRPAPVALAGNQWHSVTLTRICAQLETTVEAGLPALQRQERIARHGVNSYDISTKIEHLKLIKDQLCNVPTGMLVGSALLSAVTGGLADAALILVVVCINGGIGYRTSLSAERAISALGVDGRDPVLALINGVWKTVEPSQLVPGDIIRIERGIVPADCIVIRSEGLTTDESSLTGESHSCQKHPDTLPEDTPISGRHNVLYAGTVVTGGDCLAVVVETGTSTELGRIRALTAGTETRVSLLQDQLDSMGRRTVTLASGLCAAFFGIGLLRGMPFLEILRTSVSLAVAAIPEGLTAVGTLTFAFGIKRMQRKGIVARDLRSIENIGNVRYFCLDKTGTVTMNRMVVTSVWCGGKFHDLRDGVDERVTAQLQDLLKVAVLCNDADLYRDEDGKIITTGSPTEIALLKFASRYGVHPAELCRTLPRTSTEYRTRERRYMVTRHVLADGAEFRAFKGDPAAVLRRCDQWLRAGEYVPLTAADRETILAANLTMADQGLRVLGFAQELPAGPGAGGAPCWLGLLGLHDPPRTGVREMIEKLHQGGIQTLLITGDQLPTAISVAREMGFNGTRIIKAIDARELKHLSTEELRRVVQDRQVFARVSPEEKLIIIKALQECGHVVAMTGDGVNDSPALRAADIGVAMGLSGSSAARESADIVISDDRLETMVDAIVEGRAIRRNLKQSTRFLLATNYAEMALMMAGMLLHGRPVLSPVQLLWINMITDVLPALALASNPSRSGLMESAPPAMGDEFYAPSESRSIARDAALMTACGLTALLRRGQGNASTPVSASGFMTTVVTSQMAYAAMLGGRNQVSTAREKQHRRLLLGSLAGSWAVQVAASYLPGVSRLLGLSPMNAGTLATSLVSGLLPAALIGGLNQAWQDGTKNISAQRKET